CKLEQVVLGIDIGTSSVKIIAVNKSGHVIEQSSIPLKLSQPYNGYSEQDPESWVEAVKEGIKKLINTETMTNKRINALSFSGQMHGLVPLDKTYQPIRNAILCNDTRTTQHCEELVNIIVINHLNNVIHIGYKYYKPIYL